MSDEPIEVAATGVMDYKYFELDPGFKTDVWIKAAEARPGNRAVVHHHVAYFVPPGGDMRGIDQVKNQIAGYAPGTPPFVFPPGVAMRSSCGVEDRVSDALHALWHTPARSQLPGPDLRGSDGR